MEDQEGLSIRDLTAARPYQQAFCQRCALKAAILNGTMEKCYSFRRLGSSHPRVLPDLGSAHQPVPLDGHCLGRLLHLHKWCRLRNDQSNSDVWSGSRLVWKGHRSRLLYEEPPWSVRC